MHCFMLDIGQIAQLDVSALTLTRRTGAAAVVAGICARVIILEVVDSGHHAHILLDIAEYGLD